MTQAPSRRRYGLINSQTTMLMQNFGVTNKEYYGMLWYFLKWSSQWSIESFQLPTQASWRYPGPSVQRRLGKEREIFPTSLTGDVTSEIAEDDLEMRLESFRFILVPRALWGPEHEDQEAPGTQDLKS